LHDVENAYGLKAIYLCCFGPLCTVLALARTWETSL